MPCVSVMNQRMFASCKTFSTPSDVGAFGQPDAARIAPETVAIMVARHQNLRAQRRRIVRQQRQQARAWPRKWRFPDFRRPGICGTRRRGCARSQSTFRAGSVKRWWYIQASSRYGRVPMRAMNFVFGQLNQSVEVPHVTVLQQGVQQHGAERGRDGERQAGIHALRCQPSMIWISGM